jgi:hypothetical protein
MKVRSITVILAALTLMMGLVGMTGCSSDKADTEERVIQPEEIDAKRRAARQAKEKEEARKIKKPKTPPGGWFKSVKLVPQKTEEGAALKINVETTRPLDTEKQEYLAYVFWKNNQGSGEHKEGLIPASYYKRGDLVFAEVVYYRQENVVARMRSEPLFVENTSPVIKSIAVPDIDGPGTYTFKVTGADKDGDKLTYTLAPGTEGEKLPGGFSINGSTGLVTFVLAEDQKLPPTLKFIINANDGGGGVAKKAVTLTFSSKKVVKQVKTGAENENKEEKIQ